MTQAHALLSALLERGDTHVGVYSLVDGEPVSLPGRLVVPAASWTITADGAEAPHVTFRVAANVGKVDGYFLAASDDAEPFLLVAFDEPHNTAEGDVINVKASVAILEA